jgi:drug/metabolite transporter (DMT)-like permease
VRATVAGIIGQLTPVAALGFGWPLYGERIGGVALVGAAVTVAGVSWGAWQAAVGFVED